MTEPGRNEPCPCGSGRKWKACCLPIVRGAAPPTAEALMRSRWSAYATGAVDHLMRSTHPEGPHHDPDAARWREELADHCALSVFERLTVHEAGEQGDDAFVDFTAGMSSGGRDASFRERSRFRRHAGRWAYLDGVPRPISDGIH